MAALTGALLPAPFMISLIVLLVTGINALEAIPVLLAGVLSHTAVAGFGLITPPAAKPATVVEAPADAGTVTTAEGTVVSSAAVEVVPAEEEASDSEKES